MNRRATWYSLAAALAVAIALFAVWPRIREPARPSESQANPLLTEQSPVEHAPGSPVGNSKAELFPTVQPKQRPAAPATSAISPQPATQPPGSSDSATPGAPSPRASSSNAGVPSPMRPPTGSAPPVAVTPPAAEVEAPGSNAPDLEAVRFMVRDYRSLAGENPVGTNAEIMRAIMGENAKGARLGPPAGQELNGNGELVDRWGTPYFFHQLSRLEMEIRSAGPDRIMWTADDRVTK